MLRGQYIEFKRAYLFSTSEQAELNSHTAQNWLALSLPGRMMSCGEQTDNSKPQHHPS